MRCVTALAVPLTGLALAVYPVAQADPGPDDYYSKWLSENGVNYQGRVTWAEMTTWGHTICTLIDEESAPQTVLNARQRLVDSKTFTPAEAPRVVDSAVESYCPQYSGLLQSSGLFKP
jgi:hypothetical protein